MSAPSRPKNRGNRPRVALVLSGGGARGAYEAGVLRYLRDIDGKLDKQGERIDALTTRISALERQTALLVQSWATINERIDHIETRLDRIERRLDLIQIEAPQ